MFAVDYALNPVSVWTPNKQAAAASPSVPPTSGQETLDARSQKDLQDAASQALQDLVAVVRRALESGEDYHVARANHIEHFMELFLFLQEINAFIPAVAQSVPDVYAAVFDAVSRKLGSGWKTSLVVGQIFGAATNEIFFKANFRDLLPRVAPHQRDQELRDIYWSSAAYYNWACFAVQLIVKEDIVVTDATKRAIADDITYLPREFYLAACAGAHFRGQPLFSWMDLVYELDRSGYTRQALGLLVEAMGQLIEERPDRVRDLFEQVDLERINTALLRGMITVTAGKFSKQAKFLRDAEKILRRRYEEGLSAHG